MNEWISVKAKNPKKPRGFCLVYQPTYGVIKAARFDHTWVAMNGTKLDPTHWMPLPDPPESE